MNFTETSEYLKYMVGQELGGEVRLRMPWGEFVCTNIAIARSQFEEIFVKQHYAFISSSEAPIILDCGGNIGMSAIWFRQRYPKCQLRVFEADPRVADLLRGNLDRAGYGDTEVESAAVWKDNTEIAFNATGIDTGCINPEGLQKVRAVDVADLILDRVDLLKLDIEGAEFDVIARLFDSGAIDRVQNLAVEFHPSRTTFDRMIGIFAKFSQLGMNVSFESFLGPYVGLEPTEANFPIVGRNRMFVQAYIWRNT